MLNPKLQVIITQENNSWNYKITNTKLTVWGAMSIFQQSSGESGGCKIPSQSLTRNDA